MTIEQILTKVAEVKPSRFSDETIVEWVNDCEQYLIDDLFSRYQPPYAYALHERFVYPEDIGKDLLAPDPYSEIYLYYVYAQIDINNGEIAKYNNDYTMYNSLYQRLFDFWNNKCRRNSQHWRY